MTTSPLDGILRTADLDEAIRLFEDHPDAILLEESEEYPGNLTAVPLGGEEDFIRSHSQFVSPRCLLNDPFMLPAFLEEMRSEGRKVIATPEARELLEHIEMWCQPYQPEGFAGELLPYQQFSHVRAIERALNQTDQTDGFFFNWGTGCIQGDAEIIVTRGGNGKRMKLRDIVKRFNGEPGRYSWDLSTPTYVQREVDGGLRLGKIKDAWSSGFKKTYTLTTDSGRTIRATAEHPFLAERGWVKLGDLHPGDQVRVRGEQPSGAVHHKNEDHLDNRPERPEVLPHKEHHRQHGLEGGMNHVLYKTAVEGVVSIQEYGVEETFDLEVEDDPHNFVANGFVVHNSGKSVAAAAGIRDLLVNLEEVDLVLVFTLRKMKINLSRWIEKFASVETEIIDGTKDRRRKRYAESQVPVWVLNYEKAREDYAELEKVVKGKRVLFIYDEALALTTPILTQEGWKTVGSVEVGDYVPGTNGWVEVIRKTDILHDQNCYRVTTQDGGGLVCSENHLWSVCGNEDEVVTTVTTKQLAFMDELSKCGWSKRPVRVPLPEGVEYPEADLPLDPYVLGYWLGDGVVSTSAITCGDEDEGFVVNEFLERGFVLKSKGIRTLYFSTEGANTRNGLSLRSSLIRAGVLEKKLIPGEYMTSSREQRLELLRGLMDSDGHCDKLGGAATFTQLPGPLLDGVEQLLRSLGYSPSKRALSSSGFDTETPSQQLAWHPLAYENPFKNPRKSIRVTKNNRVASKKIVSVEKIPSVPVQCIEVDSDDHLFAAGNSWMVSHNCSKILRGENARNKSRMGLDKLMRRTEKSIVWPMSASVVSHSPFRYHDVFEVMSSRNPLGTRKEFAERYCSSIGTFMLRGRIPITNYTWSTDALSEVRHRVVDQVQTLRKTDPGVRENFKTMSTEVVDVQPSSEEKKLFDAILNDAEEQQELQGEEFAVTEHYMALRFLSNTPAALLASESGVCQRLVEKFGREKIQKMASSKFEMVADMIEEIQGQGDQVVVFTHWTHMSLFPLAEVLKERGLKHVVHYGTGMTDKEAQKAQDGFKADPSITAFVSSDAGAMGLNFQNARYVLMVESPYDYDLFMQRRDRIDRADSYLEGLTCYVMVAENEVEQRIWRVMNKRRLLSSTVQGTVEDLSRLDPEDEAEAKMSETAFARALFR